MGAFLSFPWTNIGTINKTTAAADAALGTTERNAEAVAAITNGIRYYVPQGVNAVEIRFLGTTNGDNHTVDVWAGRRVTSGQNTDICRVCTLDVETGTQVVTQNKGATLYYADELTLSNEAWLSDIRVIQSANDSELMARLYIPNLCGYDVLCFHGHTACPNDLQVEISGFTSFVDTTPA